VCLFDPDGPRLLGLQTPYKTHTMRLALAPDGAWLAAATVHDMDGSCRFEIWEPEEEAPPEAEPAPQQAGGLFQMTLQPRPAVLGSLRLAEPRECPNPFGLPAAFAFDGRLVAAAWPGMTKLLVWDTTLPVPEAEQVEDEETDSPGGHSLPTRDIGFAPRCLAFASGRPVLAAGGAGLALHDASASAWAACVRDGPAINAVVFSPDGRTLVAGTEGGTAELWDVAGTRLVRAFDWRRGPITSAAFAPDAGTCAAGTAAGDVIIWDVDG
jgi:WD40 repeat protein